MPSPVLTRSQLQSLAPGEVTGIVLNSLGRQHTPATILNVGACDGVLDDLTWGSIATYAMDAIFIEPMPDRRQRLEEHVLTLRGCIHVVGCAISDHVGEIEMCTIPAEFMDSHTPNGLYVHPALYGMSSVYPPRNGLTGEHDGQVLAEVGKRVRVPCRTLDAVLADIAPERIDLLSIDTEGHDWIVLEQFDFAQYRPYWIQVELANLSRADQEAALMCIRMAGYYVYHEGRDGFAVRADAVAWGR